MPDVTIDNIRWFCDDVADIRRYHHDVIENREYDYLPRGDNLVIVDIGANLGTFSVWVYDRASVIYAVEPSLANYDNLCRTIKANGLTKIVPIHAAVSDRTGPARLRRVPGDCGGFTLDNRLGVPAEAIESYTLNDLLAEYKIDHADVVKVDTEGAEALIFNTPDFRSAAAKCPFIIGEAHANGEGYDVGLQSAGYHIRRIKDNPGMAHLFIATIASVRDRTPQDRPLLLTSACGEPWTSMVADHRERHQSYADRHGYEYRERTPDPKTFDQWWDKIVALTEALDEGWPYVWEIEPDTLVADVEKDMRQTLPAGLPFWLALTIHQYADGMGQPWHWQPGVMYVRNCEESRKFFARVLAYRKSLPHDMAAINLLLTYGDPKWQAGVRVLDHRWNNNLHDQNIDAPIVAAWHGNGTGEQRRELMRLYAQDHPWQIADECRYRGDWASGRRSAHCSCADDQPAEAHRI